MKKLFIVISLIFCTASLAFAIPPSPIPKKVTSAEITAGTETKLRSYSPADVKSFVDTHAPGGTGYIDISGTPATDDIAQFTDANTVKGMTYAELAAIAGFESALEAVLDLSDLQGSVTDAQVPNDITIDLATLATTVTITDNESTAETNAIIFTAGGALTGGNLGLESDGDLTYNPSTGTLAATIITDGTVSLAGDGTITGLVEGGLPDSTIVTADIKDGDITEADLKVVDSPSDEDIFTYESTTGDFEWHSIAEVKASMSLDAVENTAISTWAGSANITTVGTIGTGTWQGDAIGTTYAGTDLDASNLAATITFADGDFLDLSNVDYTGGGDAEGIALPTYVAGTTPTGTVPYMAYDAANNRIMVWESGGWTDTSSGTGAPDSSYFVTYQADGSLSAEKILTAGYGLDTDFTTNAVISFDTTEISADGSDTWSDGTQASIVWTFDLSGTDHTMTAGSGLMTFGDAVTVTDTLTASSGIVLGASQAITGATAMTIGAGTETVAINSSDWDIDATGVMTGIGNITSDGVVTATGFTIGSAAILEAELEILDGATLSTTDINIIDGISDSGSLTAAELLYVDGVTSAIQTQLDARCLESVFGTALEADDLELNGTTLQLAAEIPHTDVNETLSADWYFADDTAARFGGAATDWYVEFDDSVDDQLLWHTTATAAIAITDPMFEILVDFGTANGTGMTANQQVFGVSKGTQASNVPLFTLDEDGDGVFAGSLTAASVSTVRTTDPQSMYIYEGTGGGSDYRGFVAQNFSQTLLFQFPDGEPTANNVMLMAVPSASVSAMSYGTFSTDNFLVSGGTITIKDLGVSVAEINASGTPSGSTALYGDGAWKTVTAAASGSDGAIQIAASSVLSNDTAFTFDAATNTLNITQNGTDLCLTIGDGVYDGVGHTPQLYVEGVSEFDGTLNADNGITSAANVTATAFVPTTAANAAGEIGYASNAFSLYANSEDMTMTASADLWTFNSGTAATFAFTPAVAFTGAVTLTGGVTSLGSAADLSGATVTFATIAGAIDAGGATSVEVPNGANPTTDAAGEVAVDSDDEFIEFYGTASRVLPALISETFSIVEPDTIQGITDDVVLKHFMADAYPHGVTIKDIAISASSAYTSEVFLIEEWDDRAGSTQSTVESITISSQYQEDDGTLSDAAIAADAFLVVNLDDTPEDIAEVEITVTYYVNPGD